MILFVAIEPFTQQAIAYVDILVKDMSTQAAISPRLRYYNLYDTLTDGNGMSLK